MTAIRLRRNSLSQIAKALPGAVSAALRQGAVTTRDGGMARSPVATGLMRSTHAVEGDTAGSLNVRATVSTEYAPAVHEGTRTMPGRPWLRETAEQTFPDTIDALRELEKRL